MNKKFNKKKLMTFGALSLFAMVLVTAGLVGYLSNTVQADVTIESPFVITGFDDFPALAYGDDSFVSDFQITNLADSEKPMILEVTVTANEINPVTPIDFETDLADFVVFKLGTLRSTSATECWSQEWDDNGYCMWDVKNSYGRTFVDGNKITYYYGLTSLPIESDMSTAGATIYPENGHIDAETDDRIYVTFASGIEPGNYAFSARVIPKSALADNYLTEA